MKLEKVYEEDGKIAVRVQDVTGAYLNTLRRYMTTRVPTMAIDFVEFRTNNSILYDEMVAHRLGLIPLTTDLKSYKLPETEWDEPIEDPRVEVQLTLSVPTVEKETTVKAEALESKDPKIAPVHPEMPIVKLAQGQDIELIATARLGTGEEHAKWSPAHVYYRHYPHITIDEQPKDAQDVADEYPGVFTLKKDKLAVADDAAYHMPDKELGVDGVSVETADDDYLLIIESWGQLTPTEIVQEALAAYDEDLGEFKELAAEV